MNIGMASKKLSLLMGCMNGQDYPECRLCTLTSGRDACLTLSRVCASVFLQTDKRPVQ
jgi:hypothetical protein